MTKVTYKEYNYSSVECSCAKRAIALQDKIDRHIMDELIKFFENILLITCLVSNVDIKRSGDRLGPTLGYLKGKTLKQQPIQVREYMLRIHISVYHKYKQINICYNVMKFNSINFFLSVYKHL